MWLCAFGLLLFIGITFLPLLPLTFALGIVWAVHTRIRAKRLCAARLAEREIERRREQIRAWKAVP